MVRIRYTSWDGTQAVRLDPERLFESLADVLSRTDDVGQALDWARSKLAAGPVLLYSTAAPERVAEAQRLLGADAGPCIERVLAAIARGLVEAGVTFVTMLMENPNLPGGNPSAAREGA